MTKMATNDESGTDSSGSLSVNTRAKLKEEIVSPFRNLRRYVYIGMIMGGGIGTVFAVPQLIESLTGNDKSITESATNLVIDLGVFLSAFALLNKESKDAENIVEKFAVREKVNSNKLDPAEAEERERIIGMLPVQIAFSESDENSTRIVSLSDLQKKGSQSVIIVAGPKKFIQDAVISARIEGVDTFNNGETMIVPVTMSREEVVERKENRGFAKKEDMMSATYFAIPTQVITTSLTIRTFNVIKCM
jgi:hypothetical protein